MGVHTSTVPEKIIVIPPRTAQLYHRRTSNSRIDLVEGPREGSKTNKEPLTPLKIQVDWPTEA